jgi:2-oxo-4-hydroxy-4-carboxy-5-ureidoimidazoline decarboxylase
MNAWQPRSAGGGHDLLAEFNGLAGAEAGRALLLCCASARWAEAVAAGRPYPSVADLLRRSDGAVAVLEPADLHAALAGHPRIGDRAVAGADGAGADGAGADSAPAHWPGREQAGVASADEGTLRALAAGNQAYERQFGHIYLVCATGRSAGELLALLRTRLDNDPDTEWGVVRSELQKINRIRLVKLLGGSA